jgi:hypothetical protein
MTAVFIASTIESLPDPFDQQRHKAQTLITGHLQCRQFEKSSKLSVAVRVMINPKIVIIIGKEKFNRENHD